MNVTVKPSRSWFEKWLVPERRRAERWASPNLAIYYWMGFVHPEEHTVKDISRSGLYLLTEEQWYPGVRVLLTLQRKELSVTRPDRWIAVEASVVRRCPEGVALLFVPSGRRTSDGLRSELENSASQKELDAFLSKLFMADKYESKVKTDTPAFRF